MQQPTFFIPHGGGPCFFMDDPRNVWTGMEAFLRNLVESLPERPRAVLVVSGHWETDGFAFTGAERPSLIYDYYGFPPIPTNCATIRQVRRSLPPVQPCYFGTRD